MKKWILSCIAVFALLFSVAGYSASSIAVVPSSAASVTLASGDVATKTYTVTNNTTKSVSGISIEPDYKVDASVLTATATSDTCTGATLAPGGSCTFTESVTAKNKTGAETLEPRVLAEGGLVASIPVEAQRVSVTVTKTISSIAITPTSASISTSGTQSFTATATYSDNSTASVSSSVTWSSSSTSIATINSSGLATGVAAGTSTISATLEGVSSNSVTLTVTSAPTLTSIAITPTTPTTMRRKATQQYTATGTYSDSTTADITSSVTWSSSSTSVATIGASTGAMTGVAVGTTNITASLSGVTSDTVSLTLKDFAYVANNSSSYNTVSYCPVNSSDATFNACTASTGSATFSSPSGADINPAHSRLYVANSGNNTISNCALSADGSLGTCTAISDALFADTPKDIAFSSNGNYAYIALGNASATTVICSVNSSTGAFSSCAAATDPSGVSVAGLALNPLGTFAYLTDSATNDVYSCAANASTGALSSCTNNTGLTDINNPIGVVIHPSYPTQNYAYIATNGAVNPIARCTINTTTGLLSLCAGQSISGGASSNGTQFVKFSPSDSTKLYITDTSDSLDDQVILATVNASTGGVDSWQSLTDSNSTFHNVRGIAID